METARPSSPSGDQSRQEYRRTGGGGYDKQGEVGSGSAQPEFVIIPFESPIHSHQYLFFLAWWIRSRSWI